VTASATATIVRSATTTNVTARATASSTAWAVTIRPHAFVAFISALTIGATTTFNGEHAAGIGRILVAGKCVKENITAKLVGTALSEAWAPILPLAFSIAENFRLTAIGTGIVSWSSARAASRGGDTGARARTPIRGSTRSTGERNDRAGGHGDTAKSSGVTLADSTGCGTISAVDCGHGEIDVEVASTIASRDWGRSKVGTIGRRP